jgi:uncharacterized BrkB/YihY/UPF0761 family membrane protein
MPAIILSEGWAIAVVILLEAATVAYHATYGPWVEKKKGFGEAGFAVLWMIAAFSPIAFIGPAEIVASALCHYLAFARWTEHTFWRKPRWWSDYWHVFLSFPSHFIPSLSLCIRYIEPGQYGWRWVVVSAFCKLVVWQGVKWLFGRGWALNELQALRWMRRKKSKDE